MHKIVLYKITEISGLYIGNTVKFVFVLEHKITEFFLCVTCNCYAYMLQYIRSHNLFFTFYIYMNKNVKKVCVCQHIYIYPDKYRFQTVLVFSSLDWLSSLMSPSCGRVFKLGLTRLFIRALLVVVKFKVKSFVFEYWLFINLRKTARRIMNN